MLKFIEIFSTLNKEGVRYLVVGGIAVNLYGIERATADIDLVIDLEEDNLNRFVKAIKKLGFKPKVPVKIEDLPNKEIRDRWVKEKDMKVFSLFDPKNPFFLLDVFVEMPFDFQKVYKAKKGIRVGRIYIPLIPLKDLIIMKEKTGRPQDIADVFYLKKIKKEMKDEKA